MAPESPEQMVLGALFNNFLSTEYPGEDADYVFELYSASQVLKPRVISADELADGILDGKKDGGIDSFYVFINGICISPDDPLLTAGSEAAKKIGAHPHLEVFLIQSKNRTNWNESAWEHLLSSLTSLLDLSADDVTLEKSFNPAVVERTGILRRAVKSLALKFPDINFKLVYVTRAPEENITSSITMKARQVEDLVKSKLTRGARVSATHIGVEGLYMIAGTDYTEPGSLTFKHLIREKDSYLGIVSLEDYLKFVRSENSELRDDLFDSNVRDYEGDNQVNEAIRTTLDSEDETEFWWLNNGVTILGTEVDGPQQELVIKQPLIVNGLQTTHVLDRAQKDGTLHSSRLNNGIVVRVIQSDDEETRDKIIAGTNRQTRVPSFALYATQHLQRDIERFLLVHDWYYERRKNRYKNQGKPAQRRITINLLAQAMITLMLKQPDAARARPSTLINRKDGYESIFPEDLDVQAYRTAIEVIKATDEYLRSAEAKNIFDDYSNARFYVAAGYELLKLKITNLENLHFAKSYHLLNVPLDDTILKNSLMVLKATAEKYQRKFPGLSRDSLFKSAEFRDEYLKALMKSAKSDVTSA